MLRFNMPKLRIYQQILICFGLIVSVPLLGVTFIINGINQQALKKELARFSEHTAEALYRDFGTEMSWQKQQSGMMSHLMMDNLKAGKSFRASAGQIASLDADSNAIGLYDSQGRLMESYYRDFQNLSPELRLPDDLSTTKTADGFPIQPFQVLYFNSGNPQESPYYLRAIIALKPKPVPFKPSGTTGGVAFYVQQKNFSYLRNLVRSNNSLYDAFYIIDSEGIIIAGPTGADRQERISPQDYEQFVKIRPGVTHEFSSSAQSAYDNDIQPGLRSHDIRAVNPNAPVAGLRDSDDPPPLKKVIVKMPEINWGIIIESPYHVKRKYIHQAAVHTFLLILGCLALMLLLVLPYILGISRNFRQLLKGVKAMGEGNYFRRIRLLTNFFTPYEIVYLTLEFNRMARKTADSWQTIQEANRKLAQMDEFKSGLIDTVSHELRTPLTSIKGYTSRLLRYDDTLSSETRRKSLKVVKQQADRLGRLVEDLLVIPDLEKANLRVFPDRVELFPLLDTAIQVIQARHASDTELNLQLQIDPRLTEEQCVLADPDRLEQILLNLLDNAIKYSTPDTQIEVRVHPNPTPNEDRLTIEVINACDPIAMGSLDAIDTLFDKFKRLDDSLVRTTRGSGLGLFITRGLVEAMGGQIELRHERGRFTVRFDIPIYNEAA
jgi:signal transduction histidine kinase